jgi:hypothetical protein
MGTAGMADGPAAAGSAPTPTCRVVVHDMQLEQSPNSASQMLMFGLLKVKVVTSLFVVLM